MPDSTEFSIILYPEPVLRKTADLVTAFDEHLANTVEAMYELMFESQGVGLAGPQVSVRKRILIMNAESDVEQPELNLTLINPTVVERTGNKILMEEGCLSFPGIFAEIRRSENCVVEAVDLEGQPLRVELTGFQSRVVQHEYDHLQGVLLVDRMSPADRLRNKTALEELIEAYKEQRKQV
jgi:peptide deformylase